MARSLLFGLAALTACATSAEPNDSSESYTLELTLGGAPLLPIGGSVTPAASVRNGQGAVVSLPLAWTSADPAIASVSPTTGRIVGQQAGTTRITARTSSGTERSVEISVRAHSQVPVARLLVDDMVEVDAGVTKPLTPLAFDEYSNVLSLGLTWSSSAETVAAVAPNGVLTAVSPGTARLSVQAGQRTASIPVNVLPTAPHPPLFVVLKNPDLAPEWQEAAEAAAELWNSVFTGLLPPDAQIPTNWCSWLSPNLGVLPTQIPVLVRHEDWTDWHFGTGGRCGVRTGTYLSNGGFLGVAQRGSPVGDRPTRIYLMLHELGHALGLVAYVDGKDPPFFNRMQQLWTGEWGRIGYKRELGLAQLVNVPFLGSLHWANGATNYARSQSGVSISETAIGALLDMGYPVALGRARDIAIPR